MIPTIIHKDDDIIVIDKPAGMPSTEVEGGLPDTLVKWIVATFPEQKTIGARFGDAGLLHRLDNDTSGVIVAAASFDAYRFLKEKWNSGEVMKEYTCLVVGQTPPEGKITTLIAHHPDKPNKMVVVDSLDSSGRRAETEYQFMEGTLDYSLLKVRITTGVRHQIRCHLSSIGFPIVGDKLYQRTKHSSRDWLNLPRHFLHASKIGFPHPSSGKHVEYESPLPADLQAALKSGFKK